MTSDSGSTRQDTDYTRHIEEALHALHQLQQTPRLVTSPDELETLEREIRQHTDHLGRADLGRQLTRPSFGVPRTFGASRPGSLPMAEGPLCPQAQSLALGMYQL